MKCGCVKGARSDRKQPKDAGGIGDGTTTKELVVRRRSNSTRTARRAHPTAGKKQKNRKRTANSRRTAARMWRKMRRFTSLKKQGGDKKPRSEPRVQCRRQNRQQTRRLRRKPMPKRNRLPNLSASRTEPEVTGKYRTESERQMSREG